MNARHGLFISLAGIILCAGQARGQNAEGTGAVPAPSPAPVQTAPTITIAPSQGVVPGGTPTGNVAQTGNTTGGVVTDNQNIPNVVAPPVENLVPGAQGNVVQPPVENIVPGSDPAVFPPVENIVTGGQLPSGVAAAVQPGAGSTIAGGTTTTQQTGTSTGALVGQSTGGLINTLQGNNSLAQTGVVARGTAGAAQQGQAGTATGFAPGTVQGFSTTPVPGLLRGGQGGLRGDIETSQTTFRGGGIGSPFGAGPYPSTLAGTVTGPTKLAAPIDPYEPDALDFAVTP